MGYLSIILIIGVITSLTDLKSKKIYNLHLVIGVVLGLIVTIYTVIFKHENILFHVTNGLIAFVIGYLLHRSALWRGGDAKLFTLYAFLMPTPVYSHLLFPNFVSLFACSFIAGMVILFPVFIKDIIINHKAIANELFLPDKRRALFQGVMRIIFFSWVLFPLYYLARITNPVIILTISYIIFSWRYDKVKTYNINEFLKKNFIVLSAGFIFGLLMRLWLSPNSLSCSALIRYITMIALSTAISTCIYTTFNHFKNYHERVPFAPLLFMGCVLSYTPFLTWVMRLILFIRQ